MRGTQPTRWITSPSSRSNLTLHTGLTRRGVVIDGEDRELELRAAFRVVSEPHSGAAFENGREAGRRLNRPDVYMIHNTARRCSGSVYACGWVLASDIATLRLCLVFLGRKATTPLPHPPSSSLLPLSYPPHLSTSLHLPPPSLLPHSTSIYDPLHSTSIHRSTAEVSGNETGQARGKPCAGSGSPLNLEIELEPELELELALGAWGGAWIFEGLNI